MSSNYTSDIESAQRDNHSYISNMTSVALYGRSGEGKTTLTRKIITNLRRKFKIDNEESTRVYYLCDSDEEFNRHGVKEYQITDRSLRMVKKMILTQKKRKREGKKLANVVFIFDDFQNLTGPVMKKMVSIVSFISRAGRRLKLKSFVLFQSLKKIDKDLKGLSQVFITMLPLNKTYGKELINLYYSDYKNILDNTNILPKYSYIVSLPDTVRIFASNK